MTIVSMLILGALSACGGLAIFPNDSPAGEQTSTPLPTLVAPSSAPSSALAPETQPAPAIEPTLTPDLCATGNIGAEVEKVQKIMRKFDDASLLASNTPSQQLYPAIADMQRIRRQAEDLQVPACLEKLKTLQLDHMATVINTMMAFYSGSDTETVNAGILQARQEYEMYMFELAGLLGLTPASVSTQAATLLMTTTPVMARVLVVILNPEFSAANMRDIPSEDGKIVDYLNREQPAEAFGQSADGAWYLLGVPSQPDKKAWVSSSLLQVIEGDIAALPVVPLTP
ncbi:MAG: hypothetical protein ACOYYJ_17080 [Chloroflexota bacterium]